MPEDNAPPLPDDWIFDDDDDDQTLCPSCKSNFLEYEGEAYDDEIHEGSAYKCHDCGLHFTELAASDGTWQD